MQIFLLYFFMVLQSVITLYIFKFIEVQKNDNKILVLKLIISTMVFNISAHYIFENCLSEIFQSSKLLVYFAIYLLILSWCYKGKLIKKIVFTLVLMLCQVVLELVNIAFCFTILRFEDFSFTISTQRILATISLTIQIIFWCLIFILVVSKKGKTKIYAQEHLKIVILLPISQILLLFITYITFFVGMKTYLFGIVFAGIIVCAFVDYFVIKAMIQLQKQTELEETAKRIQEVYQAKLDFFEDLEKKRQEFAKYRHDFLNRIQTLHILLENDEVDEAKTFLAQMAEIQKSIPIYTYSTNVIINTIICNYAERCQDKNIILATKIEVPTNIHISDVHMCSVLSNLLDNAIKAVENLEDRRQISINISHKQNALIIQCENEYSKQKPPQKGSGLGVDIVRGIVEKYNGEYHFEFQSRLYQSKIIMYT